MKYKTLKSITFTALLFFVMAIPFFVIAADAYVPLESLPLPGGEQPVGGPVSLGGYFSNMYTWIIGIAGVIAVLMIVVAGVEYMVPTASSKESAKSRAWAAISGLLLALMSYLILNTINPDLLKPGLTNLPKIEIVKKAENTRELVSGRQALEDRLGMIKTFNEAIDERNAHNVSLKTQINDLLKDLDKAEKGSELETAIKQSIENLSGQIITNNNENLAINQLKKVALVKNIDEGKLLTERVVAASNKKEDKAIEEKCSKEINSSWLTKGSIIMFNYCLFKNAHSVFKIY